VSGADLLVVGRIATLAGSRGLGWVDALAIGDGGILAAGSLDDAEALAGPATRRLQLEPDEVAIPGLTDAHLHLADAALAAGQVDLSTSGDRRDGLARVAAAAAALPDLDSWILGAGWDVDRWGGWPTAVDLERVAPGRLVAIRAHDHHALWVSERALAVAGLDASTPDPPGGRILRTATGAPEGCLLETAGRPVTGRIPAPTADRIAARIQALVPALLARGVTAVHDPGGLVADDGFPASLVAYAQLADSGRLGLRVHASLRSDSLVAVSERGLRSGDLLGEDPVGRARLGWLKLFADGTLGSRTAALLAPMEPDAGSTTTPGVAGVDRGLFLVPPTELAALASSAARSGIATQIHAIGDHAVRVALDALEPTSSRVPLVPRVEHVQLLDRADLGRFAATGIGASVQPIHLRGDADPARRVWGRRVETSGYRLASIAATGALLALGTDAPVEPFDPWPGLEIAITRTAPSWGADAAPFGPHEALTLERALRAACIDPAHLACEDDRGRLVAGHRADLIFLPASVLVEPVRTGGALGQARPRLVMVDGQVVFG
jgi:predicted amidohydrolase YtcJ